MTKKTFLVCLTMLLGAGLVTAGVDKQIQNEYIQQYKDRALYLKVPIHGFRQVVRVSASPELDLSTAGQPLAFKVGDQARVTDVSFKDDYVRFKLASIDLNREAELVFQFPTKLDDAFPQRSNFDKALDYALTIGLSYRDIDTAKEDFIKDQFDQLIDRFASTTGTTSAFVVQTISEKNPEFQRLREALAAQRSRADGLEERVKAAETKARAAESATAKLRSDLRKAEADADSLNEERSSLLGEKNDLAEQVEKLREEARQWQTKNREYERQVNQLIQNLEVKTGAEAELGTRVQSLGAMIDNLKTERGGLSAKLDETTRLVQELQNAKKELTEQLEATEKERSKLAANLKEITSDKNSLQSRYLQSKKDKEALQTGRELEAALRLGDFTRTEDSWTAPLFLLSQPIGTFHAQPPSQPGSTAVVRFEANSPDTVKFNEEERRLYAALGAKLQIQAAWAPQSDAVQVSLVSGEARQAVAPREKAEWSWTFQGQPESVTPVVLKISVTDANQQTAQVGQRAFELAPGGWRSWLTGAFSLWGLLAAFLVGSVLSGLLGVAVGKSREATPARPAAVPPRSAEKRL